MFTRSTEFYDAVYGSKDYAGEAEHIRALASPVGRSGGRTLLDVACGTGGHLTFFKHHFAAEGLDLDQELLAMAGARHPELRFHHADMVDFDLGRTFDKLSGGQQARFQILLLELGGSTLLALDEPTDNLDVASAEALEGALAAYAGTVIAVSHDRWFLNGFERHLEFGKDGTVAELQHAA